MISASQQYSDEIEDASHNQVTNLAINLCWDLVLHYRIVI